MANGRKPDYIVRALEDPDARKQDQRWVTIGVAWNFTEGDGIGVRMNSMPFKFDGSFILVPPFKDDDKGGE